MCPIPPYIYEQFYRNGNNFTFPNAYSWLFAVYGRVLCSFPSTRRGQTNADGHCVCFGQKWINGRDKNDPTPRLNEKNSR